MTLGANCSALLPLCRSDYQPINRAPNCLGSDAGNYLYTLMERIFQKGTPTPLSSYILCTLPCSSFYYTCPKEKREKKIAFTFLPFSFLCYLFYRRAYLCLALKVFVCDAVWGVRARRHLYQKFFACMGLGHWCQAKHHVIWWIAILERRSLCILGVRPTLLRKSSFCNIHSPVNICLMKLWTQDHKISNLMSKST